MSSARDIEVKLSADIDQKWKDYDNKTVYRDQYGNEIHKLRDTYVLYRKQEKVAEVNRLHTAKLISSILVNDIVHFKDLE